MTIIKKLISNKHSRLTITSAMLVLLPGLVLTQTVGAAGPGADEIPYAESLDKHFHPKGKPPSEHTLAIIRKARETMPFSDRRDFAEAEKGFIAPLNSKIKSFYNMFS